MNEDREQRTCLSTEELQLGLVKTELEVEGRHPAGRLSTREA